MVAVDVLLGRRVDTPRPDAVVVVLDATNLQRNLYLATQVLELGVPAVLAVNLSDDAQARGIEVDLAALGGGLGVPAVATVAHRGEGVPDLTRALLAALDAGVAPRDGRLNWPPALLEAERELAAAVPALHPVEVRRALLDVDGEAEHRALARGGAGTRDALARARARLAASGSTASLEASVRYGFVAPLVARAVRRPERPAATRSDRLDAVLTHRVWGTAILVLVMTVVFMSLFAWANPLMEWIDQGLFGRLGAWTAASIPGDGLLESLLVDGVIAGVGGVLVFLPQIVILFALLALLEGCGYMARAAFLMDRLLRAVGLSGRSFIPMLSSFACAIPGIMAARVIESRRDRIVTILVAPLMSCSARIPVYVILIGAFVPAATVWGFLNVQGLVFAAMYFVGIVVAIPVAFLLKQTLLKGDTPSFVVEFPPYRMPQPRAVGQAMWRNGKAFVVRAGSVILAASIVVWALSKFPEHPDPGAAQRAETARFEAEVAGRAESRAVELARQEQALLVYESQGGEVARLGREKFREFQQAARAYEDDVAARRTALAESADADAAGESLRHSLLGRMGHAVEPVFAPIGWDWKVGMAVIASFPAREVVVSTLGVIYNLGGDQDEESESLRERLKAARWEAGPRAGTPVFDLASALALMVFFALCAQCASTLVIIAKETSSWGWAGFTFAYMTVLAWGAAWLTATVVRALG
jgi:ferrous iron transport protein B